MQWQCAQGFYTSNSNSTSPKSYEDSTHTDGANYNVPIISTTIQEEKDHDSQIKEYVKHADKSEISTLSSK